MDSYSFEKHNPVEGTTITFRGADDRPTIAARYKKFDGKGKKARNALRQPVQKPIK